MWPAARRLLATTIGANSDAGALADLSRRSEFNRAVRASGPKCSEVLFLLCAQRHKPTDLLGAIGPLGSISLGLLQNQPRLNGCVTFRLELGNDILRPRVAVGRRVSRAASTSGRSR